MNKESDEILDLRNVKIKEANFENLRLKNSIITFSTLINANFRNSDLTRAIITYTNLSRSNFKNAILVKADLTGTNLSGANFQNTILDNAIFEGSIINEINLRNARYSIPQILEASLGFLSKELTIECMKWNASVLQKPRRMDEWAFNNFENPLNGKNGNKEIINFYPSKRLWRNISENKLPNLNLRELWKRIADEKNIKI